MKKKTTHRIFSRLFLTSALAAGAVLFLRSLAHAAEYNAERDFQTNSNPNGVWTYGAKTTVGSALTLLNRARLAAAPNGVPYEVRDFSSGGLPYVLHYPLSNTNNGINGTAVYPPGTLLLQSGTGNTQGLVTVRFTAPTNGAYRVDASAGPANDMNSQGDTDFHITKNGTDQLTAFLTPTGRVAFVDLFTLAAGDTLDFSVGPGADNSAFGSLLRLTAVIIGPDAPPIVTNPPPVVYNDFNAARDFSTNTNPNGVWSYGWKSNFAGGFLLITNTRTAAAPNGVPYQVVEYGVGGTPPYFLYYPLTNTQSGTSDGGQGQYPPGTLIAFAGFNAPQNYAAVRFTTPSNGNYRVGALVRSYLDGASAGDTDFHVLRNGTELFGQFLPSRAGTNWTNILALVAGDTVDFLVGRGADNNLSGSGLKIEAEVTLATNTPPPPPVYSDFNAARDFSTNTNPNGVWSYGAQQAVGSAFSLMTRVRTVAGTVPYNVRELTPGGIPDIMHYPWSNPIAATNGNSVFPPGTLLLHPGASGGTQNLAVLRFTTPSNGNYRIEASANPAYDGTPQGDTDYHVAKNGQELFGAFLNPADRVGHTNIVSLSVGDTLDFAVGRGADNSEYGSFLKIQAIITPTTNSPAVTNPPPVVYNDFNAARDFSTNTNPNGVWSYGSKSNVTSGLNLFAKIRTGFDQSGSPYEIREHSVGALPGVYHNGGTNTLTSDGGQGVYPPGMLWFYPGLSPNNFGAVRFTSPSNGNYRVGVAVRMVLDGASSGDADFHVVHNTTEFFGSFIAPRGQTNWTNVLALAAGDTVDFVIGRGADNSLAGTSLKLEALITPTTNAPTVTNPPPPTVLENFDLSRDFLNNVNPSGVWSYGWKQTLGGPLGSLGSVRTFSSDNGVPIRAWELSTYNLPVVAKVIGNSTAISDSGRFTAAPGTVYFAPGADATPQNFGAIRFTAPSNGNYRVETAVNPLFDSTRSRDSDFHVTVNGGEVYGVFLPPNFGTNQFSGVVALATGETIDFLIGRGADELTADTGLKISAVIVPTTNAPTITNIPPPIVPPPAPANFDLSRDFLNSANPSGVWSYGWKETLGGPLGPLGSVRTFSSDNGVPIRAWELSIYNLPVVAKVIGNSTAVSDSGRFTAAPGTVYFAPGADATPQNFGAIRFTAPSNGNYRLETSVNPLFDSTRSRDSDFHVTVRGGEVYGTFLPPNFGTNSFSAVVALQTGDSVDFLIGRGADGLTSDTGLKISAVITPTTNAPTITNVPPPVVQANFDLSRDFLTATNPSGVWSYGWKETLGGPLGSLGSVRTFSSDNGVPIRAWELSIYNLPVVAKVIGNSTAVSDSGRFTAPPGTVYFAPGADATPQNFGVIRFTSPSNGNFRIETAVNPLFDSTRSRDSDFHVVRNGVELYGVFLGPNFGTNRFTSVVSLATGDTIEFAIGRGADGVTADTGLKIAAIIAPTTEAPNGTNPPPAQIDFHLTRDFSTNQNPNGVWSYGWKQTISNAFQPFTLNRTTSGANGVPVQVLESSPYALPELLFNATTNTTSSDGGQAQYPPRTLWYYPGNPGSGQNYGAIRFTAPSNSNYQVGVAARSYLDGPSSGDTDFHVVKNGVEVFGQAVPSRGATSYTNVLSLAAGDVVDFLVGRGADDSTYGSGLKIQALITPTTAAPISTAPGEAKAARVTSFTRLANGDIEFGIAGDGATTYVIEASTDLVNWTEIGLVANASATIRFTDPDAALYPNRFYRARAGQ